MIKGRLDQENIYIGAHKASSSQTSRQMAAGKVNGFSRFRKHEMKADFNFYILLKMSCHCGCSENDLKIINL